MNFQNGRNSTHSYLSDDERRAIFNALLEHTHDGKLKKGTLTTVAKKFSTSTKTVTRFWKQAIDHAVIGASVSVSTKLNGRVGRKRLQINFEQVRDMELRRRTNIRSMAIGLGMSKSTLHRRIKEGALKPHTNAIKPQLSEENKKDRLRFCLSMIDPVTISTSPVFHHMFNFVHIDDKWFYMSNVNERYYLLPDETKPLRTCQNKRFLTKVIFLAAVAPQQFDDLGNVLFSGKIGIFPFVIKEAAKCSSKKRRAGTLETKPLMSINKEVIRSVLIDQVLPAIRSKWPSFASKMIYIQQDNAKPHIDVDDEEWEKVATTDGYDFHLQFQTSNSPDLNVLDLGFFEQSSHFNIKKLPELLMN